MHLPTRLGGLGINNLSKTCYPAFLASSAVAAQTLLIRHDISDRFHAIVSNIHNLSQISWVGNAQDCWEYIRTNLRSVLCPHVNAAWDPSSLTRIPTQHLQHTLSAKLHNQIFLDLLSTLTPADQARLRSCSGSGSGAFLSALPYISGCNFNNIDFLTALQLRLGAPIPQLSGILPRHCQCGSALDPFGYHTLNCRRGGDIIFRHNALRETFASLMKSSGFITKQEVLLSTLPNACNSSHNLRFDILVTSCALLSQYSADVTVINPISSSQSVLAQNASTNGNASRTAESRKRALYSDHSSQLGYEFVPLALEVFGRLGTAGNALLKQMATRAIANQADVDTVTATKLHASLVHWWRIKISCVLQKGNARIIQMGVHRNSDNPRQHTLDFNALQEPMIW